MPIPLSARIDVLPVRGGKRFLRSVFEPLGYAVDAARYATVSRTGSKVAGGTSCRE
jgi:hypothetical protein